MAFPSTVIRFTMIVTTTDRATRRRTRTARPCWVKAAAFKDGPGMATRKLTFTYDRAEAATFSTATAMLAETEAVLAEQHRRRQVELRLRAHMNHAWAEFVDELLAALPAELRDRLRTQAAREAKR